MINIKNNKPDQTGPKIILLNERLLEMEVLTTIYDISDYSEHKRSA